MTNPNRTSAPGEAATTDLVKRYNFLLGFLIERGVLTDKRYRNGTWSLQGIYGVDDSGLRGAGRTPEEALDNAIVAVNLEPTAARKFWSDTHAALATQPAQGVQAAGEAVAWQYLSDHEGWQFVCDERRDVLKRAGYQIRALGVLAAPTVADRVPLSDEQMAGILRSPNGRLDQREVAVVRMTEHLHGIGAEKAA